MRWCAAPSPSQPARTPAALPARVRIPIGILALLATAPGATLAVLVAGQARPTDVDRWAAHAVHSLVSEPGAFLLLVDAIGEPLGAITCVGGLAVVCWAIGRRRLAVVAVVSLGSVGVVTTAVKPLVGRTIDGYLAYPSGHTATATVLAFVAMLAVTDLFAPSPVVSVIVVICCSGAGAAAMALAQVALGSHYPTDTVGGFCAGVAIVPVVAHIVDRLELFGA